MCSLSDEATTGHDFVAVELVVSRFDRSKVVGWITMPEKSRETFENLFVERLGIRFLIQWLLERMKLSGELVSRVRGIGIEGETSSAAEVVVSVQVVRTQ